MADSFHYLFDQVPEDMSDLLIPFVPQEND